MVLAGLAMTGLASRALAMPPIAEPERFVAAIAGIEARSGGRLGVALIDPAGGQAIGYRIAERFPLCSTFKLLAAAAILARVDAGRERLDRVIRFARADLVTYSPITQAAAGGPGMTIAALCVAAITMSDNTAGNLLLDAIGGPAGWTAFARGIGDRVSRLDRRETALNSAIPGDPRDTTTPAAMAADIARLTIGRALSPASRRTLIGWLSANRTGDARLRAGLPAGWRIADKTGSGDNGTANHVALLWPPDGRPIVATVYLTGCPLDGAGRDAAIADVARAIVAARVSNPPR